MQEVLEIFCQISEQKVNLNKSRIWKCCVPSGVHKTWGVKSLARAARLVLIQSVLSVAPVYTMQSCKLPGWAIEELEKCSRDFFWGDSCTQQRSTHEVSWPTICQPKAVGGLGIRPLLQVNHGLLVKTELEMSTGTGKTVGTSANSQVWVETGR